MCEIDTSEHAWQGIHTLCKEFEMIIGSTGTNFHAIVCLRFRIKNTKKMEIQLCHACSDVSISQIKEENEKDQGNFLAYVEAYEARLYYLSYSKRKGIHTLCK